MVKNKSRQFFRNLANKKSTLFMVLDTTHLIFGRNFYAMTIFSLDLSKRIRACKLFSQGHKQFATHGLSQLKLQIIWKNFSLQPSRYFSDSVKPV